MDRRKFLKGASTVLCLFPLGVFPGCKSSSDEDSNDGDDTPPDAPPKVIGTNTIYTSSDTGGHSHGFTVPQAAFENPPLGGISGRTTEAAGHQHSVTIDQEALRRAGEGEIVKVETSNDADHTHFFTIVKK